MSEVLIPSEKTGEANTIGPFSLQFLEVISAAELEEISGRYNDRLQVWEYGDGEPSAAFPVASKIGAERPPTVCTVPTRVTPKQVSTDSGVDD